MVPSERYRSLLAYLARKSNPAHPRRRANRLRQCSGSSLARRIRRWLPLQSKRFFDAEAFDEMKRVFTDRYSVEFYKTDAGQHAMRAEIYERH